MANVVQTLASQKADHTGPFPVELHPLQAYCVVRSFCQSNSFMDEVERQLPLSPAQAEANRRTSRSVVDWVCNHEALPVSGNTAKLCSALAKSFTAVLALSYLSYLHVSFVLAC